jgi:hypothetical protein
MVINACALGYSTIIINKGAMQGLTNGQLSAVLGHEVGHLYYRDSVRSMALIFGSFGTKVFMWCYTIITILQAIITNLFKSRGTGGVAKIFTLIPILMLLPVFILNWIGSWVFYFLNLRISRIAEYRADAFTAVLGYKTEMIETLEIFSNVTVSDNTFISKITSTHPVPMERIGALEDRELQKQYFGVFSAGINELNKGVSTNNKKELTVLSIFLLLLGGLCFGYFNYKVRFDNIEHKNYISSNIETTHLINNRIKHKHKINNHKTTYMPKKHKNLDTKQDNDKIEIINQYKITDTSYSITYNYKGNQSTLIVNHQVPSNIRTLKQLNAYSQN